MVNKRPLKLVKDLLPEVKACFADLMKDEVLVGVPSDETHRKESKEITNAFLAYIHDNGSPARNIPARPFMKPGIAAAKSDVIRAMKQGAERMLDGEQGSGISALHKAGLIAQLKIRAAINQGIPPPLAESTLKGRIRARSAAKGARAELSSRAAGNAASTASAKPLVNTGQLRNSINYVIKRKGS